MPETTYEDKTLTCADCAQPFVFTARDQEFFAGKGFQPPKRCKPCREAKKAERGNAPPRQDGGGSGGGGGGGGGPRQRDPGRRERHSG